MVSSKRGSASPRFTPRSPNTISTSPIVLLDARLPTASAHLDEAGSQTPLLETTIHHLRQAIRAQADIEVPLLRSSETICPVYEAADMTILKRAVDDIKASLDDVLDLEFTAASTNPLQPQSDKSETSDIGGVYEEDLGKYDASRGDASTQVQSPEAEQRSYIRIGGLPVDSECEDPSILENEHDLVDALGSGVDSSDQIYDDDNPAVDDPEGEDNALNDDRLRKAQTPNPLTPPESSRKPVRASPSRTANVLSRLTPTRLLNLFMPSPSPTPAKPKRSLSTSPQPSVLELANQDVIESPGPIYLSPSPIPAVDHPPSLFLPHDSSSSEDELLSPLPPVISPIRTRKARACSILPPRRSTRTVKPRTSTRLAQMIPPNFRAAGSMGPYKTLPGPRMRDSDGRGRSVIRISSVTVGHKRTGSASSVSSIGSERSGGRGGLMAKRVRFEGFGTG
ncbi:MAG: hypothetical protein LQ341_005700 [Variospora aurantia]|nr:MAG: hypothetical protein LQ341_005700 [Variospora aurantia]